MAASAPRFAPNFPDTVLPGERQRQALREQVATGKLVLLMVSVLGTIGFTVLAARHTEQVMTTPPPSSPAAAGQDVPSQSLFQSAASNDGGGFLAPATASMGRSSFRSSMS
ncbi:MAG: hypothetical protein M1118_03525 [Chloroflexi bacterium]|nr:hypothetical protein [Chloroflexota bacterium]